jgi:hypothetical protein
MSIQKPPPGPQTPLSPTHWVPVRDNTPTQAQQPRFLVNIDGNWYYGESYSCTLNAHGATDQATITLPVDGVGNIPGFTGGGLHSAYPDWSVDLQRSDAAGNASVPVIAEIWAGYPPDVSTFGPLNRAGLICRFAGVVDQYTVTFEDNKCTFSCRSMAFPLTSTKIVVPFPDEPQVTTVAFIQQQAARFGLQVAQPLLSAPPVRMIDVLGGLFITSVRSFYIWELMLKCALFDDVDIWVDKTGTLHYAAASLVQRAPVYYIWGHNCKGISGTHSPQFSKNIKVTVRSWTTRTRTTSISKVTSNPDGGYNLQSYSRVVKSTPIFGTTESLVTTYHNDGTVTTSLSEGGGGGASGGTGSESESGIENYFYVIRNKTLAQCDAIAQQRWRQISMHEYAIRLRAPVTPGNLPVMDVTAKLVISGLPMTWFNSDASPGLGQPGPELSGGYWPRQIVETLDTKSGGYRWEIDAVNHELAAGAV